jgi:mannose-6-phosphate isomerase-like protein (cupin superfamily)
MADGYTIKNLRELEDVAVKNGMSEQMEARMPRKPLEAEDTGLALIKIQPGQRQPFAHKHKQAEEVYVVLSGTGTIKLDDDVVEVGAMDAIRMAPGVGRGLEAGPDGLEIIAFGPRHEDDVEMLKEFWEE